MSPSLTLFVEQLNTMRNFILLLFLLILPLVVLSETSQQNKFSECKSASYSCVTDSIFNISNPFREPFNISYPFREPNMPEYCGLPGYDITCKNNNTDHAMLVLEIDKKEYRVGNIDYDDRIIILVNTEFLVDVCPQSFTYTTFNCPRFSYEEHYLNLTVYFNCSSLASSQLKDSNIRRVLCPPGSNSYYSLPDDEPQIIAKLLRGCNSNVKFPILKEYVEQLGKEMVDFMDIIQYGFDLNWCKGCEDTGGFCVHDLISPGKPKCSCNDGSFTSDTCNSHAGKSKKTAVISGSAAMLGFLVVCLSLAFYFYKHRKVPNTDIIQNQKIKAFLEEYGSITPRRYSYSNVKKITKEFQEKLGQGGYGTVFKGTLDNGHMVAVKILNDSKGDGEEFINEVASIGRTSHVNVVSLLGFCYEGSKRALIYDFMCNGSLEKLLYSEVPKTSFDWEKLYQIAIGTARGLEYLHRGCNTRIVHFDIKPHNILLDQDFCPKISDFGLAKLCLKKESIISIAGTRGTIGYIAPEVFSRNFGVVSSKSDVYSYGMMVLEIAGGRKNPNEGVENSSEVYFPHWIYAQLDRNGDLLSCSVTAESEEIVRKMVLVGLWCIQTIPENRPSMSQVIEMMEGSVDDLQIPPKPYLSSSPFGSIISTSSICWVDCIDSSVHS